MGIVTAGEARTAGIGTMNEARIRQNHEFLIANRLVEPGKVKVEDAFRLEFIKTTKVLP